MEERLIIAVAGVPIIYDVSLFAYRDTNKKNYAWPKVSEIFGVPADECKKQWKSLRDTYRKERRKEAERKRSGAGASSVRPWRYSGVMGHNMVEGAGEALTPEDRDDAMTGPLSQSHTSSQGQAGPSSQSRERQGSSRRRKRAHSSNEFDERMLIALEAVSRRASTPQEDRDSLFLKASWRTSGHYHLGPDRT